MRNGFGVYKPNADDKFVCQPVTSEEVNNACIERLRVAKLQGRVAVVGSGLSTPHIASLGSLEEKFSSRCGIARRAADQFFWAYAEGAHRESQEEYYKVIRETYSDTLLWTADAYDHLVHMRFLGYATLNYDPQLPKALKKYDSNTEFWVYPLPHGRPLPSPLEFSRTQRRVVALHGYADPKNKNWEKEVILKSSDYDEHYINSPGTLRIWWASLLLAMPCIFIGTTLQEPGLLAVIKSILADQRDRLMEINHLHLVPTGEPAALLLSGSPSMTLDVIEQVTYDPVDENYSGLLRVLSPFSGISPEVPSPGLPAPGLITATDSLTSADFTFSR